MTNLIVIRIIPQSPVKAADFANYLSYNGGFQIVDYDLTSNNLQCELVFRTGLVTRKRGTCG